MQNPSMMDSDPKLQTVESSPTDSVSPPPCHQNQIPIISAWICPRCQAALSPGSRFCPNCGLTLKSLTSFPRVLIAQRLLLVLSWLTCLVAWLLIFLTAETVLGSGPILFCLGLAIIVLGMILKHPISALIGVAHCLMCVIFLGLVNLLDWSPHQAQVPFLIMGALYMIGMVFPGFVALRKLPKSRSPWECQTCGYLLYGLSQPRCPECGTGFDPNLLAELTRFPEPPVHQSIKYP